jgi:Ca2+-binding RTX toxin-like protein
MLRQYSEGSLMRPATAGIEYDGDDQPNTKDGTGDDDFLYGNGGDDTLRGLGGNDYIDGGVGNDNLDGGEGDDTIWDVGSIPSGFSGVIGHDIIHAGAGDDTVNFRSADGGDQADGGDGTDTINISFFATTFQTPDPITFTLTQTGSTMYIGEAYAVFVTGFERLIFYGNIGDDVIQGGDLDDDIEGAGGNDHLSGMGGDDFLDGGTGQQFLDGGQGTDTASFDASGGTGNMVLNLRTNDLDLAGYGTLTSIEKFGVVSTGGGNDTIVDGNDGGTFNTGNGDDTFTGGKGIDIWNMGGGADTGTLGDGSDKAVVDGFETDTGAKNVHGGNGNDWMFGAAGADQFFGENDDDYLNGRGGNDIIDGGAGNDTIRGGAGGDQITGGAGNDSLDGDFDDYLQMDMSGDDTVNGGAGDDNIKGGLGSDRLIGDAGNDTLFLSYNSETLDTGVDTADGGDGKDTIYVSFQNSQSWTYDIVSGASTRISVNGTQMAVLKSIENFQFSANANGTFNYTGDDRADTFRLGSTATGNDTIKTFGGNDWIESSFGGDTVDSGDGNDQVTVLLGGKDKVQTGAGNDDLIVQTATWQAPETGQIGTFDMGAGKGDKIEIYAWNNDLNIVDGKTITYNGQAIAKISNWESMRFVTSTSSSIDYVGSSKDEQVEMQFNVDTANGGGGDDTIQGGGGNDILDGGAGSDTAMYENYFISSPVSVTLNGAKQVTVKVNGVAEDKIRNFENVIGGYGNDMLTGDKGGNSLNGWGGNDTLKGGKGNDIIIGSAGTDTMTGGAGKDHFVFDLVTSFTPGEWDSITDFKHGQDKLDFSPLDPNGATARDDAFTLLKNEGAAFDGKHAEIRFDKQNGITVVEADLNKDRVADIHIQLTGAINLDKGDFIL